MAEKSGHSAGQPRFVRSMSDVNTSRVAVDRENRDPFSLPLSLGPKARRGDGSRRHVTETRIILVGKTGSGKSCTANTLLGEPVFKSGTGTQSVTKRCEYSTCKYEGVPVVVIDTPGLFDTDMKDEEAKQEVTKCIALASPGPHAILIVIPANVRYTKESEETIQCYLDLFGHTVKEYILPVFTKTDLFKNDLTNEKNFLKTLDPKLKYLLDESGDRHVFVNNRAGNKDAERRKLLSAIEDLVHSRNKSQCFTNEAFVITEKELERREQRLLQGIPEDSIVKSSDEVPVCPAQCIMDPVSEDSKEPATSSRSSSRRSIIDDGGLLGRLRELLSAFIDGFLELLRGRRP